MRSDFELIDAWKAGEAQAGTELFDRHFQALYRFFRNKAMEGVDDLVQQTFLGCVEGRDRMRGEASFRTYMFAVARNQLYRYWQMRSSVRDDSEFESKSLHDMAPSAASVLARRSEERLVLEALRRIPIDFQIALECYYFESMRGPEIARVMGTPEATVRSRLRRGLEHLREQIEQLSTSAELLDSTLTNLEQWARNVRDLVEPPPG